MFRDLDESEKKKCSVCGSDAFRVVSPEYGKKTYYAFEEAEAIDEAASRARPTGATFILRAFGCSSRTCGHVDFYSYTGSRQIKP